MRKTRSSGNHKNPHSVLSLFRSPVALAALLVATVTTFAVTTFLTVSPTNLQGWQIHVTTAATATPTPSVTFVNGPGVPPLGTGSAELRIGANGADAAQLRHPGYAGTRLPNPTPTVPAANELSSLSYATYVQQFGSGGQAPYIILQIDTDGDAGIEDLLFFEPVYQSATFCPSNPQPALVLGQWQNWDAFNGCWYSVFGTGGSGPGTNTKSLRHIAGALPPTSVIANSSPSGLGGVRITTGFGAGAWDNFIGNVDAFRIGVGSNDTLYNFDPNQSSPTVGTLFISEYRLSGPSGVNDEFIEVYNNTDSPHVVTPPDGSGGYSIASSSNSVLNDNNPTLRCTIPFGAVIPPRGHFLCTNSVGYSQEAYPGGPGPVTPDATYGTDIPLNDGIALLTTNNPANINAGTRIDAVGSKLVTNAFYREGVGHSQMPNPPQGFVEHSFVRRLPGGCTGFVNDPTFAPNNRTCPSATGVLNLPGSTTSKPQDTDDNLSDFLYVGINVVGPGTAADANIQIRLGAPGPENTLSPVANDTRALFTPNPDRTVAATAAPNRVRDIPCASTGGVCPAQADFGYLDIRKVVQNNLTTPVTRLRFRITDISAFPTCGGGPPGFSTCTDGGIVADVRAITSSNFTMTVNDPFTCGTTPGASSTTAPCLVPVDGTTLEVDATAPSFPQPNGGGFNSSLSTDVSLGTPLLPGQSRVVNWRLGVEKNGKFRFFVTVEALPFQ